MAVAYHLLSCFLGSEPKASPYPLKLLPYFHADKCLVLAALLRHATELEWKELAPEREKFGPMITLLENAQKIQWLTWVISFSRYNNLRQYVPVPMLKGLRMNVVPAELFNQWQNGGRSYTSSYFSTSTPADYLAFQQFKHNPTRAGPPTTYVIPQKLGQHLLFASLMHRPGFNPKRREHLEEAWAKTVVPYCPPQYNSLRWPETFYRDNDFELNQVFQALMHQLRNSQPAFLLTQADQAPYLEVWKIYHTFQYRVFVETSRRQEFWTAYFWPSPEGQEAQHTGRPWFEEIKLNKDVVSIIRAYWVTLPLPHPREIERLLFLAAGFMHYDYKDLSLEDRNSIAWLESAQPRQWRAWVLDSSTANGMDESAKDTWLDMGQKAYITGWRVRHTPPWLTFQAFIQDPVYDVDSSNHPIPRKEGLALLVAAALATSTPDLEVKVKAVQLLDEMVKKSVDTKSTNEWILSFSAANGLGELPILQALTTLLQKNNWDLSPAEQTPYFEAWSCFSGTKYDAFLASCEIPLPLVSKKK